MSSTFTCMRVHGAFGHAFGGSLGRSGGPGLVLNPTGFWLTQSESGRAGEPHGLPPAGQLARGERERARIDIPPSAGSSGSSADGCSLRAARRARAPLRCARHRRTLLARSWCLARSPGHPLSPSVPGNSLTARALLTSSETRPPSPSHMPSPLSRHRHRARKLFARNEMSLCVQDSSG